jgi:predicted PurR-regulated permease PerM
MPSKKLTPLSAPFRRNLVLHDFARYFFMAAILSVLGLFFWVISPFFNVLIYACLIAVLFSPVHRWFVRRMKMHQSIAAFLSTVLVALVVLTPLALLSMFLVQQAVDAYTLLNDKLLEANFSYLNWDGSIADLPWIGEWLSTMYDRYGLEQVFDDHFDVFQIIQDFGKMVTSFIVAQSGAIVASLGNFVMTVFILLLTMFFFFRDGPSITEFMKTISPLPRRYENEIVRKLREATYSIVMGNFATSLVQGFVGAIGLAIAGVHNVIFWGTLMAFTSLIPYVGASLIWLPVALGLLLQGEPGWALFVCIWGLGIVATVDNFVRPIFIGNRTNLHPLATFLTVLGGIFIFGIHGIVFGPMILSLTVTIMHIYQLEYKEVLKS